MRGSLFIPILLILLLVPTGISYAANSEQCSYRDHAKELGDPNQQADLNWCGLAAGSDLLAYRLGIKPPDKISLLALSRDTFLASPAEVLATPHFTDENSTLKLKMEALADKYADYQASKVSEWGKEGIIARKGFKIDAVIFNANRGICLDRELPSFSISKRNIGNGVQHLINESRLTVEESGLSCSLKHLADPGALRSSITEIITGYLSSEIKRSCHAIHLHSPLIPESFDLGDSPGQIDAGKAISVINDQLDRENIVGINFKANFVLAHPVMLTLDPTLTGTALQIPGNSFHAVSVIGRRFVKKSGQCELELRNSWGTSCEYYRPVFQATCKSGNFWVPEKELGAALESVTYIQK